MRLIYCLMLLLCPYSNKAQPAKKIKPLAVGDHVPDIAFGQMINYNQNTTRLSQFKGKLLLLDFWATWCGNCVKKFDMLDSMQRKYPDKFQVILINSANTRDTKEKLANFFERQKNGAGNKLMLPAAYNEPMADKYFPHKFIPHYIWIDKNSKVKAITDAEEVTIQHIEDVIRGKAVQLAGIESRKSFDLKKFLFVKDSAEATRQIRFRSTLGNYMPGVRPDYKFFSEPTFSHYLFTNTPMADLLNIAYSINTRKDRTKLNVSDSIAGVLTTTNDSIIAAHSYCYEFIGPPMSRKESLIYMQQDLLRYFGIYVKKEKLPLPCYLLQADTAMLAKFRSKGGKPENRLYEKINRYIRNKPLTILSGYLDWILDKNVIQQTDINYNLDLALPDIPEIDMAALQQYLQGFGITLTPTTATIEQFVIYQSPKQ